MGWRGKLFMLAIVYFAGFGSAVYMSDGGEVIDPPEEIHEVAHSNSNINSERLQSQCRDVLKKTKVISKQISLKLNDYVVAQIENYRQTRKTPG